MKMWSGRFRQGLDPEFEKWQRSFGYDQRLLPFELSASRAHARALEHAGVLSSEELAEILDGLNQIARHAEASPDFLIDPDAEDVHHFVEKKLASLIGESGYKLHAGRSRNEQIAADLRLFVRATIDELQNRLADLMETILARAETAGAAAMPGFTHLQPAEPVLVSHWLLAYAEMLLRDSERLASCRKRVNLCPLGSGAIAGAPLALDRRAIATELGFADITANSMDATSDRDFALEFVQALTLLGLHLSRWAEEMILFSAPAYDFVVPPEPYSTGSSAMPQKKNPDLLELVRGKAARVLGFEAALQTAVKGLPLAYNKDLQETQEPVFGAADTMIAMLPLVTGWMRSVEFNFTKMREATETGFINAWAAAAYLVERGVASRQAHEAVGKAVRLSSELKSNLQDLKLKDLKAIHPAFDSDLAARLELSEVLAIHDVPGGTAPQRVKEAIRNARERVNALRAQEQLATG
jgi:argininosuccinate lyase